MIEIKQIPSPHGFAANTYLIRSDDEYAVIDPTAPFDESLCQGKVRYILLTHPHFDHILEIDSWVEGSGAEVIISAADKAALGDSYLNCYKLFNGSNSGYFGDAIAIYDGQILPLGDTKIEFISTPGHTAGSGVYVCDCNAFVGDTIFEGGGYGRYDLPTGNFVMLRDSIQRLLRLDDNMVVYPGHGDKTTIKQYKTDIGR